VSDSLLDELISEALRMEQAFTQPEDYEALWEHLEQAKPFGRQAFDAALRLLGGDTLHRTLGCDLLAVLCNPDNEGWSHEAAVAVVAIAHDESDADCCWSIAEALRFVGDPVGVEVLVRLAGHPDSDVRFKAACALPGCAEFGEPVDQRIVAALLELMDDSTVEVRDWATFGLGTLLEVDSREIREGLLNRLEDDHDDTRYEALLGLARRRDPRALAPVTAALQTDSVFRLAVEAATYLASSDLLPSLIALRKWWDVDTDLLERAIELCDPAVQAIKVRMLEKIFSEVQDIEGVSISVCCDLYETYISIESVRSDGRTLLWGFDELIARAGHQNSIGQLIKADLA
jgi:hypothetical protein